MGSESPTLATAIGLCVAVALSIGACRPTPEPQVHEVTIDATSYSPRNLEVRVGDTVIWTNHDLLVHTVTARNGTFDSTDIAAGASWRTEVPRPGGFDYFCLYHPTMEGSLSAR